MAITNQQLLNELLGIKAALTRVENKLDSPKMEAVEVSTIPDTARKRKYYINDDI